MTNFMGKLFDWFMDKLDVWWSENWGHVLILAVFWFVLVASLSESSGSWSWGDLFGVVLGATAFVVFCFLVVYGTVGAFLAAAFVVLLPCALIYTVVTLAVEKVATWKQRSNEI